MSPIEDTKSNTPDNPSEKSLFWICFHWFLASVGTIAGVWALILQCDDAQFKKEFRLEQKTIRIEKLINEANDFLGGKKGATIRTFRAAQKANIELARRNLKEASILDPENPKVKRLEATILAESGDCEKAIQLLDHIIISYPADPENYRAFNTKGLCYQYSDKLEDAVTAFEKAKSLKPKVQPTYTNLGRTYLLKGDLKKAEDILLEALNIDSKDIEAISVYGAFLVHIGKTKEGIEYLRRSILLGSTDASVYYNLGIAYYKEKEYETALDYFKSAVDLNTTDSRALHNLGYSLMALKRNFEALEPLEKAYFLDPTDPVCFKNLMSLYIKLGYTEKLKELENKKGKLRKDKKMYRFEGPNILFD